MNSHSIEQRYSSVVKAFSPQASSQAFQGCAKMDSLSQETDLAGANYQNCAAVLALLVFFFLFEFWRGRFLHLPIKEKFFFVVAQAPKLSEFLHFYLISGLNRLVVFQSPLYQYLIFTILMTNFNFTNSIQLWGTFMCE